MNKAKLYRVFWTALCALVLVGSVASCNTSKRLAKGKRPDHKSSQFLTKRLERNQFNFTWLSANVKVKTELQGKEQSLTSVIKVRHDSVIWVKMLGPLNVELAKVLITRDSIKFVSKYKKQFWVGNFNDLNQKLRADLDFEMLEDLIVGNAVGFQFDGKYKSDVDTSNQYVLTSKGARKVRKAVDIKNVKKEERDKKNVESDSTLGLTYDERKLQKALEKTPEDELLVLRYWLDPISFQLNKVMINDLAQSGVVEVGFGDFREVEEQQFPYWSRLFISDLEKSMEVELKYSRVKINKPTTFPFKIKPKYEQIIN